jgi:tetratricopeptide (TPR) repeat protein
MNMPKDSAYYFELYQQQLAQHDLEAAIESISKAIAFDEANPELYFLRSKMFYALERFSLALGDTDKAITLSNDAKYLRDIYIQRAILHEIVGAVDHLFNDFAWLIENNVADASIFNWRATHAMKHEAYQLAIDDLTVALSIAPNTFEYLLGRAIARHKLGDHQGTINDLDSIDQTDLANSLKDAIQHWREKSFAMLQGA